MGKTFYYKLSKISYAKDFLEFLNTYEIEYDKLYNEYDNEEETIDYVISCIQNDVNDYRLESFFFCYHKTNSALSFFRKVTNENFCNQIYEIEEINGVVVKQTCEIKKFINGYKRLKLYKEYQDGRILRDRLLYVGEDGRYDNDISNAFDYEDNSELELTDLNKNFLFLSTKNI